ncbi:MAG: hypothetical protein ACJZ47_05630 [bacterium]
MATKKNEKPLGKGFLSETGSIEDKVLASMLRGYKSRVAGGYRSLTKEDIQSAILSGKHLVSPKVDGELWFLIMNAKDCFLANPNGRVISGNIPLLEEAAKYSSRFHDRTVLAGELFAVTQKDRARVGDLRSAMGGGKKADVNRLGFMAFDILEGGDKEKQAPFENYTETFSSIQKLLDGGKRVQSIRTDTVGSPVEIEKLFEELVDGGKAEGLVARDQGTRIYKIKPSFSIDMVVLGYTEKTEDASQVRSILLGLMRADGQYQVLSGCGNLKSEKERKSLMKKIKPLSVSSSFRQASGSGEIYQFIRPEIVVEIKVTDIQVEHSSGDSIKSMVISFEDNSWKPLSPQSSASLIHPVLENIRVDKEINKTDIRFSQLQERVLIQNQDQKVKAIDLPASKILRREVWSKSTKGTKAVQKLLLWKTNKEKIDSNFPAFIVHWTDYSPNRKDPLKKEVRISPDKKNASQIADKMIEEKIKKGWEKH